MGALCSGVRAYLIQLIKREIGDDKHTVESTIYHPSSCENAMNNDACFRELALEQRIPGI